MRGALLLVFGLVEGALVLLAFRLPHVTVSTLVDVMAGFVLLDGVASLAEAVRARGGWWWLGLRALAGVTAGTLMLTAVPAASLTILACWAILTGLHEAIDARPDHVLRLVSATLAVVLGILILVGAFLDPARALVAVAAYALIGGALQVWPAPSGRSTAHR